jgi:uncharacterized membrane protein YraQ (UPF0718 family)
MTTTLVLISIAVISLIISFIKSKKKTFESFKIAKNLFFSIFVEIIGVMALVGLLLAIIPPDLISKLLGGANDFLNILFGAFFGTITIIPGFIAFPLAKTLKVNGANLTAIAAFITTLTMVGFATIPIERKYFGGKFTLYRNLYSFIFAIGIALLMGVIL